MMKELNHTEPKSPSLPNLPEFKLKDHPFDILRINDYIDHPLIKITNWLAVESPKLHTGSIKGVFHPPCYL